MKKVKKSKKDVSDKVRKKKSGVDTQTLQSEFRQLIEHYQTYRERPRYYGQDAPLYMAELKTLALLAEDTQLNLTQLTHKIGTTKSAVSKCTTKLMEKGIIEKKRSSEKLREVVFDLTPAGQKVYEAMKTETLQMDASVEALFEALSLDTRSELSDLLKDLTVLINRPQESAAS